MSIKLRIMSAMKRIAEGWQAALPPLAIACAERRRLGQGF
jgi:hypothetical protein